MGVCAQGEKCLLHFLMRESEVEAVFARHFGRERGGGDGGSL